MNFELLKEFLNYNPLEGTFTWIKKPSRNVKMGASAGTVKQDGYLHITFRGKVARGHRVAFYFMTGESPKSIDHINRNKADNRWENLRTSTQSQQLYNTGIRSDNTSGVRGVSWHKASNKWMVRVGDDYLGLYEDLESAKKVHKLHF